MSYLTIWCTVYIKVVDTVTNIVIEEFAVTLDINYLPEYSVLSHYVTNLASLDKNS